MTEAPPARQFLEVIVVRNAQDRRHKELERNQTHKNPSKAPVDRVAPCHTAHDGHSSIFAISGRDSLVS